MKHVNDNNTSAARQLSNAVRRHIDGGKLLLKEINSRMAESTNDKQAISVADECMALSISRWT